MSFERPSRAKKPRETVSPIEPVAPMRNEIPRSPTLGAKPLEISRALANTIGVESKTKLPEQSRISAGIIFESESVPQTVLTPADNWTKFFKSKLNSIGGVIVDVSVRALIVAIYGVKVLNKLWNWGNWLKENTFDKLPISLGGKSGGGGHAAPKLAPKAAASHGGHGGGHH
jgi:hypothetical protein